VLQKFKILKHDPDSAPQERDLGSGKATDILAIHQHLARGWGTKHHTPVSAVQSYRRLTAR